MKKTLVTALALLTLFTAAPLMAAPGSAGGHDIAIKVNGLVCDFCARAIDKVFRKQDAVEDVNVNLGDGLITVDLKEGQTLDDDTLTKMVTDAGYNVTEIIHQ